MKRVLAMMLMTVAGCTETGAPVEGTQSLEVTLVSPADPGAIDRRLDSSARTVMFDIVARDAANAVDSGFAGTVNVYAQFLGTLTPNFGEVPLAAITLTAGEARGVTLALPNVFGPTVVWIDNGSAPGPSYEHGPVTGTSPTLWYPDPHIIDLQTPRDLDGLDALTATPLQDKQVTVIGSRHGATGRLVVTSVFAQGYTVSDVNCTGEAAAPPCTAEGFDHALVFTFSAPRDGNFRPLEVGQVIDGFAGGLTEFVGLTEIGFPSTFSGPEREIDVARIPAPALFEPSWFRGLGDPTGMINFERNEAAAIEVRGVKVCDLDEDFVEFKQWKIDPSGRGGNCFRRPDVISVVSTGLAGIDPEALVGQELAGVVGVLRPLNFGGSGNIWLIFPRSPDDFHR
jgi:hypothetical protein